MTTFNQVATTRPVKYTCPIHGNVTREKSLIGIYNETPMITVTLFDGDARYYCLLCYADWLENNISKLIEEK